jgi:hypothetical protein
LLLLSLLVCASNAFAWGADGHRIVCRIAFDLLTPAEQKEVDGRQWIRFGTQESDKASLTNRRFFDLC